MIAPGLLVLATLVFSVSIAAQPFASPADTDRQQLLASYGDGFLEEVNGLPVLHVKGSPREMGRQYGILAGDRVEHAVEILDQIAGRDRTLKRSPIWLIRSLRKIVGFVFWFTFPDDIRQEIEGMVDGARERGARFTRFDVAFLNSVIDLVGILKPAFSKGTTTDFVPAGNWLVSRLGLTWLTQNCDSMAVWGHRTVDGKTFQTRNVDIDTGKGLEQLPLVVVYKPEGRVPYVTAGFGGFVGVFTGMNAYGVGLGQVWGFSKKTRLATPWAMQIKDVFSRSHSAAEAVDLFRAKNAWSYGSNFVFADGEGHGFAVELNADRFVAFIDNDHNENRALWRGQPYAEKMRDAVLRGDAAMDPVLRSLQDASAGPDGDPRSTHSYQSRYKGQADRIARFESAGIAIGRAEAESISRDTASRTGSLQAAVYANTDRQLWVSYSRFRDDGSLQQAWQGEYHHIPFAEYLPSIIEASGHRFEIRGDEYAPRGATRIDARDLELLIVRDGIPVAYSPTAHLQGGDQVQLRHRSTGFVVDMKTY
jgi:hypothetical protein